MRKATKSSKALAGNQLNAKDLAAVVGGHGVRASHRAKPPEPKLPDGVASLETDVKRDATDFANLGSLLNRKHTAREERNDLAKLYEDLEQTAKDLTK